MLEWVTEFIRDYGYVALFVIVLLENAGLPVPGETAVLTAGFAAHTGHLRLPLVILVAFLAAVVGDNCGFWVGREVARPRLQRGRALLLLTPRRMAKFEAYFHRFGPATIFVARFVTGLRVIGAPAAGAAGMPWSRFLIAQVSGAAAWATTMGLLGYFFGHAWEQLHGWIGTTAWVLLGAAILAFVAWKLVHWLRQRPAPQPAPAAPVPPGPASQAANLPLPPGGGVNGQASTSQKVEG
jgi:membrane protein DedA with SNARE-associated domain